MIDVHTGLGARGINQIMANPLPADPSGDLLRAYRRENSLLKRMFPESDCEGLCEVVYVDDNAQRTGPSSFVTTGDLTQWVHDKYPDKRLAGTVISVTSEIGTAKGADVLQALVNENFCYWNRNDPQCGDLHYQKDVHALRETFTPTDPQWQMQAVRAAHQICSALGVFAMEP